MKPLFALLMLALIVSCRTHKDIQRDVAVDIDSVATSSNRCLFASLDSASQLLHFDFDTIEVSMGRLLMGDTIETFRLKAVNGRIINNRSQFRNAVELKEDLDSTAYKISSVEISAEHTATTRVYDPPKLTFIICVSIAILLLCLYIRKR